MRLIVDGMTNCVAKGYAMPDVEISAEYVMGDVLDEVAFLGFLIFVVRESIVGRVFFDISGVVMFICPCFILLWQDVEVSVSLSSTLPAPQRATDGGWRRTSSRINGNAKAVTASNEQF